MTLDVSLEAIEADLMQAERGGTPGQVALFLARAQVRATLLAAMPEDHQGRHEAPPAFQPLPRQDDPADIQIAQGPYGDSFAVPASATFEDRITAAAVLLGIDEDALRGALTIDDEADTPEGVKVTGDDLEAPVEAADEDDLVAEQAEADAHALDQVAAFEELDADEPEDVFAEARRARKK